MRSKYFSKKRSAAKCIGRVLQKIGIKNNAGLRVISYHSIAKQRKCDRSDIFTVSSDAFQQQIRTIAEQYDSMPSRAFIKSGLDEAVYITFDDGYSDLYNIVSPLLKKYNLEATYFVTAGFIGKSALGMLSKKQLESISKMPYVRIGSHGFTHRKLTELSSTEVYAELRQSKEMLEDIVQYEVDELSFPHGAYSQSIIDTALEIGYRYIYGSDYGVNNKKMLGSVGYVIKRTDINVDDTLVDFKGKLSGAMDWRAAFK